MDLISIIIIIFIIKKVIEKAQSEQDRIQKNTTTQNIWDQVAKQVKSAQSQNRQYSSKPSRNYSSEESEKWKKLAMENIEKARKRAAETLRDVESAFEIEDKPTDTYQMPKQNVRTTPAYEQITLQQVAKQVRNTPILERAVKNADENKEDVTLTTMEAEHNHSERVSSAEHLHPEDAIPENMLETIEDLMIKGYDGALCFERDFVGEAMDMISRFSVPSDVPDFSKDDVA